MTIEFKNFDIDNISLHANSYENILVYDISYETLIARNLCVFGSIK